MTDSYVLWVVCGTTHCQGEPFMGAQVHMYDMTHYITCYPHSYVLWVVCELTHCQGENFVGAQVHLCGTTHCLRVCVWL